jgi:hypothetical protein
VRFLVPAFLGFVVFSLGMHYSSAAAGLFLGGLAAIASYQIGGMVRGRAVRNAPAPPERRDGENPLLHGPLTLRQAQGPDRAVWAYLSDQRLSLLPLEGGDGVHIELKSIEEIRPGKQSWKGGEMSIVTGGQTWRLKVPDAQRWISAMRGAAR